MRRRTFLAAGGALAFVCATVARQRFSTAMTEARARIDLQTAIAQTRHGPMQWAELGEGNPILMVHGTGGGFDQGVLFCQRLVAAGWRVIAPSRFGYLRTPMPAAPSPRAEAEAFADLLDTIGIGQIAVIGGSAGAMPALEFAIRFPERATALVALVPAAYAPGRLPVRPNAVGAAIMRYGLQSDALFWAGTSLAEDRMFATLLATDPALIHAASPEEQSRARAILKSILPVSQRTDGLLYDGRTAADPPEQDLQLIRAPTLAISTEDDGFQTLAAARHIATTVAGARLLSYPMGGHIWIGHDREIMAAISDFLHKA